MKRILVVITTAFVKTGGLASVMLNYWRALDKTGFIFDFASTNIIEDSLNYEISKEGSKYYQLPKRRNIPAYFNSLRNLCIGYDIIHVHANSATSIIELIAAKKSGISKRIHHNHTSKTRYPILNKIIHPLFLHSYTDAIACSEVAGNWLFGKGNFNILPNAIDLEKYRFSEKTRNLIRAEFGIKKEEFLVGHIGKFMDAKNHNFLIKVFSSYHSKHPKSKLMLVGDGEWRNKIERWVSESGCSDSIILTGLRSDINKIVQAFDVFVFPSIFEGLPLSVLEAQSSGLPCLISSNVADAVNVGRDVVMKDLSDGEDSWADAIEKFDYSMSREERSEINYKLLTKAHFNIITESNKLLQIYNK